MQLIPPYLNKGDTVLVIATARARNEEAVQPALSILKSWGLKVETGKNIFKKHHQFAGTDEERCEDLQWAVDHKTAKAVLIAGGGYGTLRIIDGVIFKTLKKHPKWFIGYSDTTVLHCRLNALKIAAIHATMAFQFSKDQESTQSIKNLLFGKKISYKIPNHPLNRKGSVDAEVVGGNLSLIYALSGSVDDLITRNKILFIEDLDEQLYHVDRMIIQLKRSGKLKGLKGLIVGGMSEMKDNTISFGKNAEEIILDALKEYNYPVCFNFPAGHIQKNMALYLGKKAKLNVKPNGVRLDYL